MPNGPSMRPPRRGIPTRSRGLPLRYRLRRPRRSRATSAHPRSCGRPRRTASTRRSYRAPLRSHATAPRGLASRTDGAPRPSPDRPAAGSSRLRSPLVLEDPVDHEVEEPLRGPDATAQHALLAHPQALGDRTAPRVGIRRTELHPVQPELVEGEVEEPAARARDDPPSFEVTADPVADLGSRIGHVDPKTHRACQPAVDPDPVPLQICLGSEAALDE